MRLFLKNLGPSIVALLSILFLMLTTTVFFIPILILGLLKLLPVLRWQVLCTQWIDSVIKCWIDINSAYVRYYQRTRIHVTGLDNLNTKSWYLVVANHQSWLDIVLLQLVFNRKIPMLKFFIKDQLKWIPLLGFAWWAMGSPFMKRYSSHYLKKYPHKKGRDLKATHKALSLFYHMPSTVMNFIEGTRFTPQKKEIQQSPYQHLLKPKAGGIQFVIQALNMRIKSFLDVTIIYPHSSHSLWDFLCGRVPEVIIHVREIAIPPSFTQDPQDENLRLQFRDWINQTWEEKDALISQLRAHHVT